MLTRPRCPRLFAGFSSCTGSNPRYKFSDHQLLSGITRRFSAKAVALTFSQTSILLRKVGSVDGRTLERVGSRPSRTSARGVERGKRPCAIQADVSRAASAPFARIN